MEIPRDVAGAAPFGTGENSAEQRERISSQQPAVVLLVVARRSRRVALYVVFPLVRSDLAVSLVQRCKALRFPFRQVAILVDLVALLHQLQHVAEVDAQRAVDSRQLAQQNFSFLVVAVGEKVEGKLKN